MTAYRNGEFEQALRWLTPPADNGNNHALTTLGLMYHYGQGVTEDDDKAFELFSLAAENGDANAQFHLGNMYIYGYAKSKPDQDLDREAARWFIEAAVQNQPDAQYTLGIMLMAGTGVIQDPEEGAEWIARAAKQGHKEAQAFLGEYPSGS